MPADLVIGAQWGDEGKAKVIDYLSKEIDIIVRYQGGANAGHTVVVHGKIYFSLSSFWCHLSKYDMRNR